jgi:hypothetical protein
MALGANYVTGSGLYPYSMPQVMAFLPINYIVETSPALATFDAGLISEMTGAVIYQPYSRNIGPKCNWPAA